MRPPTIDASGGKQPRAFPVNTDEFYDRGMLLRDYFAAAALTGLIARNDQDRDGTETAGVPDLAYQIADAMLERRKKPAG